MLLLTGKLVKDTSWDVREFPVMTYANRVEKMMTLIEIVEKLKTKERANRTLRMTSTSLLIYFVEIGFIVTRRMEIPIEMMQYLRQFLINLVRGFSQVYILITRMPVIISFMVRSLLSVRLARSMRNRENTPAIQP